MFVNTRSVVQHRREYFHYVKNKSERKSPAGAVVFSFLSFYLFQKHTKE